MEETNKEPTSSIFESVKELLPQNSDTLSAISTDTQKPIFQKNPEWSLGEAPVKSKDSPNYDILKEASERGSYTSLIDTEESSENMQTAVNMLLRSPELKEYIGQYALSNDDAQNLSTLQQAVIGQKNYSQTPNYVGEVNGQFFTGGEAYFLDQLLQRLQNSNAANDFFGQLREQINTEVIQKIETNEKQQNTEQGNTELGQQPSITPQESKTDAFSVAKKIINEREGELVDDLTRDETWNEMRRILGSPEYQRAQTEEIGYDSAKGHPDPEIRAYETEMNKWRKQLPHPEFFEPEKPKNYEERRSQPKIDYDRRRKEGLTFEDAVEAGYRQYEPEYPQQEQQATENQPLKTSFIEPTQTENQSLKTSFVEPTQTEKQFLKTSFVEPAQTEKVFVESLSPKQQATEHEQTTALSNFQPQQEQPTLETTSELPTSEKFAQVEATQDLTSEEILSNTEKTNTTLESLTKLLASFIQMTASQGGQTPQTVPIPMSTGSSNTQPGITDAELASGQGMIPNIRSKFRYVV